MGHRTQRTELRCGRTWGRHILFCHTYHNPKCLPNRYLILYNLIVLVYVIRGALGISFRIFCLNKCTWRVWGHLPEMLANWPFWFWSFCFLRSSLVKMAKAHRTRSCSQGPLEWQCPCWPGLEGPLEWRHYWADGSRPYLKYQKYARGSIIRINMMENYK